MGKLILCSGKLAKNPFRFEMTDTCVYSIEELCYYIYNNIYAISEGIFDNSLVVWLKEEIGMESISNKLKSLLENKNGMKDIVVSLLCSCDYYSEREIKDLIKLMDQIYEMPYISRQKIKADYYLNYGNYTEAARTYQMLLDSKEAQYLSEVEYGDLVHNQAIAYVHIASYREAALLFKEAYLRNRRVITFEQYLYALKLGKFEDEFYEEAKHYQVTDKSLDKMLDYIKEKEIEAEQTKEYNQVEELIRLKDDGKVNSYYNAINDLLETWKDEYRQGVLSV